MDHNATIARFYTAFGNKNAEEMIKCYHPDITFEDPAFGQLKGKDAMDMWRMLLSRDSGLKISFQNTQANGNAGSTDWEAHYTYTGTGRPVINKIHAVFTFSEGKIITHTDHFDLWAWTRQALGLPGYLLGWSGFMRKKIQGKTNALLRKYQANQG